jgi:hypothetical protein
MSFHLYSEQGRKWCLYLLLYLTVLHWHWCICFYSASLWSSFCCCVCCIFDVAGGCCQLAHRWGNNQGLGPQLWDNCPHIPPLIGLLVVEQGQLVPYQNGHEVLLQIFVMSSLECIYKQKILLKVIRWENMFNSQRYYYFFGNCSSTSISNDISFKTNLLV